MTPGTLAKNARIVVINEVIQLPENEMDVDDVIEDLEVSKALVRGADVQEDMDLDEDENESFGSGTIIESSFKRMILN